MTKKLWFSLISTFSPLVNLYIFTLFLLARNGLCIDPKYLACVPKTCGDGQNITFPFYIDNHQEPYCGYPGFKLSCNKKKPVLKLLDNDYIIHQIFYKNQSLRVSNAAFDTNIYCLPPIQNISLTNDFEFVDNQTELFLLYNCNTSLPGNLLDYTVNCSSDSNKTTNTVRAILEENPNLSHASNTCKNGVVALAPVDMYGNNSDNDIGKLLTRGFVLKWIASNCSVCETSGGKCGFDDSEYHFKCYCPDRPHANYCVPGKGNRKWKLGLGLGCLAILTSILSIYICRRRYTLSEPSSNKSMVSWKKNSRKDAYVEAFIRNYGFLTPKRYSYSSIKKITNSFQVKLGQGGYGSVYKGKLQDGKFVAVKVLNNPKSNGKEFINEVASISRTSHVNIVALSGFCFEGSKRALVYEFMPNGSLEKFIYNNNSSISDRQLGWKSLYQISLGIARGLEYLHRGCKTRIVHFDIKPHNILLDEDFCPKISDFGLSKLCPGKDSIISMTGARGTPGYIAPEVFCRNFGEVSHKSDVYSYGMMVLEMVGGRKNIDVGVDRISEIYFPHWIYKRLELHDELGLQGIANEEDKEFARKMIIVSLWCIQTNPSSRPPMSEVVGMLEGSLEYLQIPPQPFLSSPSRPPADSSTTNSIITL